MICSWQFEDQWQYFRHIVVQISNILKPFAAMVYLRMPTFHSWIVILHLMTPNSLTGTIIEHAQSCTKFDARHVSRHFELPLESVADVTWTVVGLAIWLASHFPGPSSCRSIYKFSPSKSMSVKIHPCNLVHQNPGSSKSSPANSAPPSDKWSIRLWWGQYWFIVLVVL